MSVSNQGEQLASKIFSKSEVQNRIAVNTVKMIVGDMVTLYQEFRKAEGLGALFFNPDAPENSHYMPVEDIKTDIILAEEILDNDLRDFLRQLLSVIDKEQDSNSAVVVLINSRGMSTHLIDLNTVESKIDELANAFSRD